MSLRRAEERQNATRTQDGAPACLACASRRVRIVKGDRWAHAIACQECSKHCDTCGDTGYVFEQNVYGHIDSARCPRCAPIRRRITIYNDAHIPTRYADAQFQNFEYKGNASLTEVVTRVRSAVKTFKPGDRGMGLSGDVGTGKTMLMACFVRYMALHREIPARFIEFSHLLSDIRQGYDAGRSEADIVSHLVNVPILIIDELGKSLKTEWQVAILDALISRRYNESVSTFFTTNFPITTPKLEARSLQRDDFKVTSLQERLGSRMYTRLTEMCAIYTIRAPNRRGPQ